MGIEVRSISGQLSVKHVVSGCLSAKRVVSGAISFGSSAIPAYDGVYDVTPHVSEDVILETSGKKMLDNVTVAKIPYYETSNPYGDTVYIGSEV